MTEEIMIRFNRQAWEQNRMINIDDYGVDLGTFDEQEPASPKDWRPYCFNKRCCKKEHLGILLDMEPCKSCPYSDLE